MRVVYKTKSLQKVCTNSLKAEKIYGKRMAKLIQQRISEFEMADSVEQMIMYGVGRCHPLHGDREGQYAVDLVHPKRMIVIKIDETGQGVSVEEIVDYH